MPHPVFAPARRAHKSATKSVQKASLGRLPEWNLADLYPSRDAPEVKRDLDRADAYSKAFEETFKGKLADMAAAPDAGAQLAEPVRRYEMIDDLLGRLISYAGLVYAGDTTDPACAKFYGDIQDASPRHQRICCSSRLSSIASMMR